MSRSRPAERESPSKRLRDVLYTLWVEGRKEEFPDFDVYYDYVMEGLIEFYKKKIKSKHGKNKAT